jgi:hypothetical protein
MQAAKSEPKFETLAVFSHIQSRLGDAIDVAHATLGVQQEYRQRDTLQPRRGRQLKRIAS